MTDSKRLKTLKRLTDYLRGEITVANGYQHDLGTVTRGLSLVTDDYALPHLNIRDNLNPDREPVMAGAEMNGAAVVYDWILLVQGWVEDDPDNATDPAEHLLADVKKALAKIRDPALEGTTVYHLGNLVADIRWEPGTVREPDREVSARAFFWMRVILKFTEKVNDPYDYGKSFVPDA